MRIRDETFNLFNTPNYQPRKYLRCEQFRRYHFRLLRDYLLTQEELMRQPLAILLCLVGFPGVIPAETVADRAARLHRESLVFVAHVHFMNRHAYMGAAISVIGRQGRWEESESICPAFAPGD